MNQNDSLNKESLERVREIQLCIITTNSKELDNIRQNFRMAQWEHVLVSFDPSSANVQNIYISSFTLGIGTPFPFYITSCSGQDVLSFAVEATSLLIHLKPKFAIFTGEIAAAGTVTLKGIESYNDADVICGEVVINYEERVSTQGSDREKIEPKITTVGKESGVLRGWVERGKQTRKYGTFVSCPTVPWHSDTRHNSIIQSTGIKDTFALDMEASTFITVCEHLGVLSLGIIKGLGNPEASNSTAKAIEEWVKSYFEPTVTVGPTSHATGYDLGYILASTYFEEYKELVRSRSTHGSEPITTLAVVLPEDKNPSFFTDTNNWTYDQLGLDPQSTMTVPIRSDGTPSLRSVYYQKPKGLLVDFAPKAGELGTPSDIDIFEKNLLGLASEMQPQVQVTVMAWDDWFHK